jgi:hypothetical protein
MGLGPANSRRYVLSAAQLFITLSLLFALIFLFDWTRIGETLAFVRFDFLVGVIVCLVVIVILGALNIWVLLNGVSRVSFRTTLNVYLLSWCSFLLLPGSAGDAVQLVLFKQAEIPYRESGTVYLTDKIVSLGAAMAVGIVGGLIYFRPFLRLWVLLGITTLLSLIVTAGYKLGQRSGNVWMSRVLSFVGAPLTCYRNHSNRVRINVLGTLIKFIMTGLSHWLAFRAVGAEVGFGVVFTVAVLAGLVAYLPIAFNGLGTVELAAVTLYGIHNVPAHQVLATYVILRTGNILLAILGLLLFRLLGRNNPSVLLLHR